jgi:predicted amidohydrolase
LFRRDGSIAEQQKIHVTPNEARWWGVQGGNRVEVFDTDRGKIGILICYDVEFPELARRVTEEGALLLFVPFNTNDRDGLIRVQTCARARCIENQIYVVTSGCTGNLPFVENADLHYAQSGVYTPADVSFARDGIAAEAEPNVETVVIHDLDLEALRRARRTGTVRNWNDRRHDLYRLTWHGED